MNPNHGIPMSMIHTVPEADAAPSATQSTTEAKLGLLREVALALEPPVLPDDPFPECVTARNMQTAESLAAWAGETRATTESLAERLREEPDEKAVPVRAHTRLRRLAREWRVFETFRLLHEAKQCPGVFFRLRTKADFLTLCDREADSSAAGYGEDQRRVLSKRGISHRHIWAEARRQVAKIGLLDGDPGTSTSVSMSGDGLAAPEEAVELSVASGADGDEPVVAPEAGLDAPSPETPRLRPPEHPSRRGLDSACLDSRRRSWKPSSTASESGCGRSSGTASIPPCGRPRCWTTPAASCAITPISTPLSG